MGPSVATSVQSDRNPKNEDISGKEVDNQEVVQFSFPFLFCFHFKVSLQKKSIQISAYLESSTALKPLAPELHKCYDWEGAHNAYESNMGISKLQLVIDVNSKKQPLPHRTANGVGTHQEAVDDNDQKSISGNPLSLSFFPVDNF